MVSLSTTSHPLAACVREGSKDGLAAAWALIKIVLPVSVVVTILDYLGMVQLISKVCRPVLTLCGLPGEAVFPLISGAFLGVYSAIAALTSIQGVFTLKDLNIMAVMIMIAHNLVVETAIQRRCGIRGSVIVLVRILAALATGAVLALIIPNSTQLLTFTGSNQFATTGLANVLVDWLWGMARLLLKISSIVIALMIIYRFIEAYGVLNRLSSVMSRLMKLFGLSKQNTFPWLASSAIGLGYSGAIILNELKKGLTDPLELVKLNLSMGLSHSFFEDTILFLLLGAQLFWLLVPKFLVAALVVQAFNLMMTTNFGNRIGYLFQNRVTGPDCTQ